MTAPATANMKSLKTNAKQIIVKVLPVRMVEHVKIKLMATCVFVKRDSVGSTVRMTMVFLLIINK